MKIYGICIRKLRQAARVRNIKNKMDGGEQHTPHLSYVRSVFMVQGSLVPPACSVTAAGAVGSDIKQNVQCRQRSRVWKEGTSIKLCWYMSSTRYESGKCSSKRVQLLCSRLCWPNCWWRISKKSPSSPFHTSLISLIVPMVHRLALRIRIRLLLWSWWIGRT